MSRIVRPVKVTSSRRPPSTLSRAIPLQPSNTQFETVMFLKPPLDSVPNLIRPVRGTRASVGYFCHVPSMTVPTTYDPLTKQFVIVTFSVARAVPSANELFGQIASSYGEFTVQLDTRTFRQQSRSMPSRLVSMVRLSTLKLSTP